MTWPLEADPLPDHRARTQPVTRLVVHAMAETIKNGRIQDGPIGQTAAARWLEAIGLSAHALIRPDGTVVECVPLERKAYHAAYHNEGSVGVELLVPGVHDYDGLARALGWDLGGWEPDPTPPASPYTDPQYEALAWWLERSGAGLGLGWEAVTSHDRLDPSRKFDPGPTFDWPRLESLFRRLRAAREAPHA